MFGRRALTAALTLALSAAKVDCFGAPSRSHRSANRGALAGTSVGKPYNSLEENDVPMEPSRRNMLFQGLTVGSALLAGGAIHVQDSSAAVGTLPEFSETNAILQGLTVNVADQSQQKSMVEFLINGLGFKVLRQRIRGPIEETVSLTR